MIDKLLTPVDEAIIEAKKMSYEEMIASKYISENERVKLTAKIKRIEQLYSERFSKVPELIY